MKSSIIFLLLTLISSILFSNIQVEDEIGKINNIEISRDNIFIQYGRDWTQNTGWPQVITTHQNYAPQRGVSIADITNNGYLEIITSSNNQIWVFDYQGNIITGWPVTTINTAQLAPSVADVDNDGDLEIVQGTRGQTSGGRLYCYENNGIICSGFPVNFNDQNISGSQTLYDLDNDGTLEIISGTRDYPIGHLRITDHDGTQWGGNWPFELDHVPTGTAAVGDVDNDGEVEIVYMSYNSIYLLNTDGTLLPGFPYTLTWGNFSYQSIALCDVNNDSFLELICANHGSTPSVFILDHTATLLTGWPYSLPNWTYAPPSVVDLYGDGSYAIICGISGGPNPGSQLYGFDINGILLNGFPVVVSGSAEGPYGIGDFIGTLDNFIAFDNNLIDGSNLGFIYACDTIGNLNSSFPLRPTGFTYMNGIQLADLDRDGKMEIINLSTINTTAYVNVWTQPGYYNRDPVQWETYHSDNQRTGLYNPLGGNTLPDSFNLIYPDSGFVGGDSITLIWESASDFENDSIYYWLIIDTISTFETSSTIPVGYDTTFDYSALDLSATYYWYISADDRNCSFVTTSVEKNWNFEINTTGVEEVVNIIFKPVISNYPNPFKYSTAIEYNTSNFDGILSIYNISGQLINEFHVNGNGSLIWNGKDQLNNNVSKGIYFYSLEVNNSTVFNKMEKIY